MFKRLFAASIWASGNIRPEDWRFRGIFRYVLPISNIIFLYFGVVGFVRGVGSVTDLTNTTYAAFWSGAIALTSVACLVGVSFPKLGKLELGAKLVLIGLVASYVAVLTARSFEMPGSQATAGLMSALVVLPTWRVLDLGIQLRKSKAVRK